MRGKLNVRFLAMVTGLVAVFAVGWFFLHRYQKHRRLGEYLLQATRQENEQKFDRAARLLRAYVLAVPEDADAAIRYGDLLHRLASTRKAKADALGVYDRALRQQPGRHDARRRAAELALELGQLDAAFSHLRVLQEAFPTDGKVLLLAGLCHESRKEYAEAAKAYDASRQAEFRPEPSARLAVVYRDHLNRVSDADKVMDDLVAGLPGSADAFFARAFYLQTVRRKLLEQARQVPDQATALRDQAGSKLAQARKDLADARRLGPDRPEVLLASAEVAFQAADGEADAAKTAAALDETRGYLRAGMAKAPREPQTYLLLARVELHAGRRGEAVQVLKQARKAVPPEALPDVLFALADVAVEAPDPAVADDALAQLQALKQDPARIDLSRGRLLVNRERWFEAANVLERARPLLVSRPADAVQADLLLASCYSRLGDIDRQLNVLRRAVAAAPLDPRPRFGLAGALVALGRPGEAIEEYRHLTQMAEAPVGAWLAVARLTVYQNLVRAEADRNWDDILRLLDRVEKVVPDAVEVPLLRAEVKAARGDRAGALLLLTGCRDRRPKESEFWCALATLKSRDGDTEGAAAVLDAARQQLGDTIDLRLTRLRITAYDSPAQAAAVLAGLVEGAERFPPDDQARLLRAVAGAYWQVNRPEEAGRLWGRVAELRPTELQVRLQLFDAALRQNDGPGMQRVLEEIRKIEGGGPLQKYGEATRLVWLASKGDRAGLVEARSLLMAVAARRPGWSRVPLGLAGIDELEGNDDRAVEWYRQAVELGERQFTVVRRLIQLLFDRQRYAEADEVLRRLQAQSPISNDLQRLAAEVSFRNDDADRALTLARGAVSTDSKDFREHIWLGQLLAAAGRGADAEKEFDRAVALGSAEPDPWVALVQYHARRGDASKAEEAVRRAGEKLGVTTQGRVATARCHELTGQRARAEALYLEAVKVGPKEPRAIRAVAEFYQRSGDPGRAEPFLRALLATDVRAPASDVAWARRTLALGLGLRTDDRAIDEAIGLLDQNVAGGETTEDVRTRAVVVGTRAARRREAIALFERAEKMLPPRPEHEFLLARLYEAEGNWPKARDRFLRLVGLQKDNSAYLTAFARSLLRRRELAEAQVWIGRLREVSPHGAAAVSLQARLWELQSRDPADSVALLREYAEAKDGDPADPAERALTAATLADRVSLSGTGHAPAAELAKEYFTRYRDLSNRPDAGLPLAAYHGRHNEPDRALALCEKALPQCPVGQVATVAAAAVSGESAGAHHYLKVEGWLTAALAANPNSDDLQFFLAAIREHQGRFSDAESAYRQVLSLNARHTGALNNLAVLHALSGRTREAGDLARRALDSAPGPSNDLLDTRAIVSTAAGELDAAQRDLKAAIADGGPAVCHFHLAVVYFKKQDNRLAGESFRTALAKGLRRSQLHPLERKTYDELAGRVGTPR